MVFCYPRPLLTFSLGLSNLKPEEVFIPEISGTISSSSKWGLRNGYNIYHKCKDALQPKQEGKQQCRVKRESVALGGSFTLKSKTPTSRHGTPLRASSQAGIPEGPAYFEKSSSLTDLVGFILRQHDRVMIQDSFPPFKTFFSRFFSLEIKSTSHNAKCCFLSPTSDCLFLCLFHLTGKWSSALKPCKCSVTLNRVINSAVLVKFTTEPGQEVLSWSCPHALLVEDTGRRCLVVLGGLKLEEKPLRKNPLSTIHSAKQTWQRMSHFNCERTYVSKWKQWYWN